ncbi:MAG TPA: 1-hydroxycarotenoid 3,4-desaturase CrtD, partial [Chitinophagales bacterium]|nr:1-hydroxycarotenoid 3,4-desaturase CrtD [Chitinophagales bacterium]
MISKQGNKRTVAVVGSGVGGLAAAVRLARRGFIVHVFEANNYPGGKATKIERDGFFWGFGPSLFTFPELLDELFVLCSRNPRSYCNYKRIDPICHYFYPDGTRLNAYADKQKFANEIETKTGEPGKNVLKHLNRIEKIYNLTRDIFLFNSVHKIKTYLRFSSLKALFRLPLIGINTNMNTANEKQFTDARVVQLFNRYATYNGSNPYQAPSTLNVIAHPEYNRGGYFLEGGMPDLTESLYKLAIELGVTFHFNSLVEKIELTDGKASGVWVNGKLHPANTVVSNMDVVYTYKRLLPGIKEPKRIIEHPRSTSALIFYWGIKREFAELDLHNIFFSADYEKEFDHITRLKSVYNDPTVYVFISKKYQPKHAPAGCENWFTLINVPYDSGQDWEDIIAKARKNILKKLSAALGVDVEPLIISETINSPKTIEAKTLSYLGALYGSSSNDRYSAFLRHPNFSKTIP